MESVSYYCVVEHTNYTLLKMLCYKENCILYFQITKNTMILKQWSDDNSSSYSSYYYYLSTIRNVILCTDLIKHILKIF